MTVVFQQQEMVEVFSNIDDGSITIKFCDFELGKDAHLTIQYHQISVFMRALRKAKKDSAAALAFEVS